ncbi:O-antigen ligase family protein [Arthrobacter sp. M-10]|uniref:O-antigen ligase family protein n=1 Tax=Arthrobacter sp. M-10 TaxID=3233037 RepID=UPI003F8F23AF
MASIVAIFVLAYRYASGTPILERKFPIAFAVLPALILVVGYVAKVPMMLSDQVRAAGTFSHPNAAAAFFCVSGVFCFSAWWPKRTSLPAWGVALSATAIVLTGSLGGIAALIAGILLVVTISSRLKPIQKAILLTTVIVVAVAGYSVVGGSGRFAEFESFDASAALQTGTSSDSLEWRLINWQLLIPYWQSKPWLGQGIGTTYKYIMPLGGPPHSLFVQLLVETGVIGCVIIAVTWFASASAITKKLRGGSWEATGLLALMSVLVVNGSESNLLGYTAAMYAFAFYGGILSYGIASRAALPPTPTNRLSVPRLPGARI